MAMTKIIIPLEPKPQTRPKFSKFGVYEDPKMKQWRRSCSYLVRSLYDGRYFESAIRVRVSFFVKAPQSIAKEPSERAKRETKERYADYLMEKVPCDKKPDLDNLEKAVYDSISDAGCVWKDDNIIVEHTTRKVYSPNPRIEVEIEEYV